MNKNYEIKSKNNNPEKSETTILISIPIENLETFKDLAIKTVGQDVKLPGFRPGKAPAEIIEKKIGPTGIMEEEIDLWLKQNLPELLSQETPSAISLPKIIVKKAAPGNPVEIELLIPIKPKFTLTDYKKISKKINANYEKEIKIEEKELDEALKNIKQYLKNLEEKASPAEETKSQENKEELPELTDKNVQKISPFKTVAEFKSNLEKNMLTDKIRREKEKNRAEIINEILKEIKIGVPETMIEGELNQMLREFEHDVKNMNLKFEDYLKHLKKTPEDLKNGWRQIAETRVKSELLLKKIAEEEKIEPETKEVEKETLHILEHNKELKKEDVESYVRWILRKEKTLFFLEELKS